MAFILQEWLPQIEERPEVYELTLPYSSLFNFHLILEGHIEWQFAKCTSKPIATDALGVRTPGLTANYSCSYNDIPRWAVIG